MSRRRQMRAAIVLLVVNGLECALEYVEGVRLNKKGR